MTTNQDDVLQDEAPGSGKADPDAPSTRPGASDSDAEAGERGEVAAPGGGDPAEDTEEIEERDGVTASEHLAAIDRLRLELDKERDRTAEMKDALVRTAADFDNFRKRVERDRVEERKQASANMVRSLLPVVDALGRALQSASASAENTELRTFVDGVRMIEGQLMDVLRQAGLELVDTSGIFDPVHHEALMQEGSTSKPHMSILDVFEPGYRLGGRLLRPARVKVAFNPGGGETNDEGRSADEGTGDGA